MGNGDAERNGRRPRSDARGNVARGWHVRAYRFTADGHRLVVGSKDEDIYVLDTSDIGA
jgi:hypothetical protein